MTREEIREGVAEWVGLNEADEILQYLHSQGVVIKVEDGYHATIDGIKLVAVEPLIEDGHNDH